MYSFRLSILLVLLLAIQCAKKKQYTAAERLFVDQAKAYEKKINDYLFELGSIQWRIYGIMDKYNNNPSGYLSDATYQTLIKQKDTIVGKSSHNSFNAGGAGTDMNINIINIGVDEDKIDSLDLSSLKNTPGVIVMKDSGLSSQLKASTQVPYYQNLTNSQMLNALNAEILGGYPKL